MNPARSVRYFFAAALLLALTLTLPACGKEPEAARRQFFALGTLVDITLYPAPENADDRFREAEATLRLQERRWRAWPDEASDTFGDIPDDNADAIDNLVALNQRLQAGESAAISPELESGIRLATCLAEQSGQRFNPAIGELVEAWQFHIDERPDAPPPADDIVNALVAAAPTLDDLQQLDSGEWRSNKPALYLDMGAFAKGLAVDAVADQLLDGGVRNGIVNAGGDLVVLGTHGNRPWRIGVRHPRADGVLAAIEIEGRAAVFTSGDYERKFEYQDKRYHHILDPQTGYPARGSISVTVVHPEAARADAAATALFVAGDDWRKVAAAMQVDKVMRVDDEGRISITRALRDSVSFPDGEPAKLEVVD